MMSGGSPITYQRIHYPVTIPDAGYVRDIDVRLRVEPGSADPAIPMRITLSSPDGRSVVLHNTNSRATFGSGSVAWGLQWGGPGMEPVPGDYDGDGAWDAAVYSGASGKWYVTRVNGTVLAWNVSWGGAGMAPVSGDYDGDGIWDLACYDESSGAWHVRTLAGAVLADGVSWGGPGLEPVK